MQARCLASLGRREEALASFRAAAALAEKYGIVLMRAKVLADQQRLLPDSGAPRMGCSFCR